MKFWTVALLLTVLVGLCMACKPPTTGIALELKHNENGEMNYEGRTYKTEWGKAETIEGHLRIKDRHYDESMPVVPYDLILTSGEFSDPDVVKIRSQGKGSYSWRSKKQKPEGELIAYHTVPASVKAQRKLDQADEGVSIKLTGRISQNSEIKGDDGSLLRLGHDNHKFILVEDVSTGH